MFLNWFDPQLGYILIEIVLLLAMASVISSIGFYRVVYFISIGYAFSILAMAIATPFRHLENITWTLALQDFFLALWGLRLGVYLVKREFRISC